MSVGFRVDALRALPTSIVTRPPLQGTARALVVACCAASIAGIGAVDYLTDARVSLAVFYLVPTVIGAVLAGAWAGSVLALLSATAWSIADSLINGRADTLLLLVGNGVLRFLPIVVVVVLLAELRRLLERTRQSERRTREFLAAAAHQLRTPVAGVQATAETLLLGDPALGSEREQLLANLAGESSRVGRLIHSLLRVARLDQGEPPAPCSLDPRELCEREVERFRRISTVDISLVVSPRVPHRVALDQHDVAEILANLLDNARRHAVHDIEVALDLDASTRRPSLAITVGDDGPGLPDGDEQRVFERFVTLDQHGGSGLGLSIARGLAEKHRGSLTYHQRRFVLVLPV
jgi:signal transduction histidine kinase